ncbi:putative impact protein [Stemphylium lycopersici]|uniref:Impact protein n=1 Tax=Stemphylium lycopersici TaxID=183478 RepID=A0A364MU76_STELY|nr:putative impact protein [Stemphylium lycopersici]RAR03651.1 impact protein [Stemphylium lycopersici]
MTLTQDFHTLLRFLSQDAKIPLAQAMNKIKDLQAAKLNTASDLAKTDFETLKSIFEDDKAARQCLNAAKRVSKKRTADDASAPSPSAKKPKPRYGQPLNGADLEASLALPNPEMDEDILRSTVLYTNRAPLVLAFAVTLIKYTMPEQPVSSRLSLAQAVTSMNSKTKAVHLGLDNGQSAEEEGWGEGQPLIRVMTRDIRVMKRWGYEWAENSDSTQATLKSSPDTVVEERAKEPALWGVDLEALKRANQPGAPRSSKGGSNDLPVYTAQSARAYLIKAFETPPQEAVKEEIKQEGDAPKKAKARKTAAVVAAEKKRNLGLLLGALELLYKSWAEILSKEDLDKRAWGWYVRVRPEVAQGAAGWGGKGNVKLSDILDLRRPTGS